MFCYQCEETMNGEGCTKNGMCGKKGEVADLQDDLIYVLKSVAFYNQKARKAKLSEKSTDDFMLDALFSTITNTDFRASGIQDRIDRGFALRDEIRQKLLDNNALDENDLPEIATVTPENLKDRDTGILATENEDIRSLRELLIFGLKGIAAYGHHAMVLGQVNKKVLAFIEDALVATADDSLTDKELVAMVLRCGEKGFDVMAALDQANTTTFGNPEPTAVNIGTRDKPGILVSGHDLKDLKQLLDQTEGTGVDVYTHGEMLPANAYPELKKYEHLAGNYGGSWWHQKQEFESFNGPILLTSNCLVPPKKTYLDRLYTTGSVGFDSVTHILDEDGKKDFSAIIEQAKTCEPPVQLEEGTVMTGFAYSSVLTNADKIVDAIKAGKIKKFIVMAGCDGRHKNRQYYTDFAEALPKDTVILTAGCAKYRYNKLDLGEIDGIPRVLDAGQCNDSFSLVIIAQGLMARLGFEDVNDAPISYNIAWYEQKAVLVLLTLLRLGINDITLGPTLPAFVSPNVLNVLVDKFNITANTTVEEDMERLLK
ncbi:hydroxylamine reductase [Methanococcoides methylutens]|uniref:Hydroxylamine reductase n=1 Tax=Methanococcoides methylutens MM1 TaxID=1434104 RepID=A0A0E3SSL8_METMT|nr:hydroxylamine reductase [Methanococcoides methylutens]AKB85583.1 Hydroxylamine reductase [Methanococcoides methylutens MM1]